LEGGRFGEADLVAALECGDPPQHNRRRVHGERRTVHRQRRRDGGLETDDFGEVFAVKTDLVLVGFLERLPGQNDNAAGLDLRGVEVERSPGARNPLRGVS